ncbi:MAG: exodeoxyribonuclease VII small subunit [Planctomycetota bacterium]
MTKKKPTYQEAVRELEEILEAIEGEEVDIDDLSGKVERAAELIRTCREKIADTEARVTRVVQELEKSIEGETGATGEEATEEPSEELSEAEGEEEAEDAPEDGGDEDSPS